MKKEYSWGYLVLKCSGLFKIADTTSSQLWNSSDNSYVTLGPKTTFKESSSSLNVGLAFRPSLVISSDMYLSLYY